MSERQDPPLRAPQPSAAPDRPVLRAEPRAGPAQRSIWRPVFLVLAGLACVLVGLVDLSGRSANPVVPPAISAAEEIAVVTAGVYVSLRAINAALSAAQEVELGASIGAQASVQPLKVLEPVDDTVERVADVVFAVAAGAALAVVGLGPVAALGLVVLGVGLVGLALGRGSMARASLRAVRLGAALGVLLPIGFAAGVALGERVTAPQWDEAIAQLNRVTAEAEVLIGGGADVSTAEDVAIPEGLFERLGSRLEAAGDTVGEAVAAVARYRDAAVVFLSEADALFGATLTIIGVFVLRTLVLPALLLWAGLALLRRSVG